MHDTQAHTLAHDIWRHRRRPLQAFFSPRTVAVIGATETPGAVGRTIFWNLLSTPFGGTVFPVNPKRPSVMGVKAYPTVAEVPAEIDLAVVVTPASTVPGVIRQCVDAGIGAAIIISAGFKELGPPGAALEAEVLAEARRGSMRIIGPNCLGVMNPLGGLNATYARGMACPGNIAFISQSEALVMGIMDRTESEQVGFSGRICTGSKLDVGSSDLIEHLGVAQRTQEIKIKMESIGDGRMLVSDAREVTFNKPIIVIKA